MTLHFQIVSDNGCGFAVRRFVSGISESVGVLSTPKSHLGLTLVNGGAGIRIE